MVRSRVKIAVAASAAAIVMLMTGCASETYVAKLVDTKPPTQLLRNEISSRVPTETIDTLGEADDVSIDCGEAGMLRSWRASQLVFIAPASASELSTMMDEIVGTLEGEGWEASIAQPSRKIETARLASARTSSIILITGTQAADADGNGASIEIAVTGPCVSTDGPDSDEVRRLESRA